MPVETGTILPSGFQKPPLRSHKTEQHEQSATAVESTRGTPLLRSLVWAYFLLLLLEGALRKWFLPEYSAPLLVIRDPIVLAIYFLAHQQRIVPRDRLFRLFMFQAAAGVLLMFAQYVILRLPVFVLAYGYRTLFLHLPLIFILPYIFSRSDVVRLGKFTVLAAIPMAALMSYQFNAPPDAWINKTVGLSGTAQIASALGKIRPPGTFSFVSGPVAFFALVTAFVGYGLISPERRYSRLLLLCGAISIGLALTVSGSRAAILSGAIVVMAWIFGTLASRGVSSRMANSLIIVAIAAMVLLEMDSFQEGKEVLTERIEMSSEIESAHGGLIGRVFGELIEPLRMLPGMSLFGAGLGLGTNVGANLLTGKLQFIVSEGEWGRILLEMGPLFGLLYIWLRLALAWDLGKRSVQAAKAGDLLPLLLFSACAVNLINGQIAQPTTLGFTVLVAALCACSLREPRPTREMLVNPRLSKTLPHAA